MIDNDIIGLHRKDSARTMGVLVPDRGLFWLWVCAWVGRGGFSKKLQVAGYWQVAAKSKTNMSRLCPTLM